MSGRALVVRGDALRLPLPDGCVDLIVTSPPYLWKRKYAIEGAGELGNEPDWRLFLGNLWTVTDEMLRVLKPVGSIFVNLGDTRVTSREPKWLGVPVKSRLLLPERYRIGCQDRGIIVRQVQVWWKANGLPESIDDRTRDEHEDWIHLVKQPRYYSAIDEVREPHSPNAHARRKDGLPTPADRHRSGRMHEGIGRGLDANHPLGKLPGSVWTIGESIWDGPIRFCPRCGRDLTAGNGRAGRTQTVMVSNGLPESATSEPTASPMNSGSAPSPSASPSTTSAATEDASTPPILSPSPASRMSPEAIPPQPETASRPTAITDTNSPPPRLTPGLEVVESARCVCETVCEQDAPGSVWSVPSEPLRLPPWLGVDHYAAFPSEWPRRFILGWSPPGICVDCGTGRFPVVDSRYEDIPGGSTMDKKNARRYVDAGLYQPGRAEFRAQVRATILGYACACTPHTDHPERRGRDFHAGTDRTVQGMNDGNGGERFRRYQDELANPRGPVREYHLDGWQAPPTRPALVLDPFGGTGTVGMVARALGRHAISIDLSHDYSRAARWRIFQSGNAGKALARTNAERQATLL